MMFVFDPSKARPVKKPTKVLVKVQQSIATGHDKQQVLVYNQDRSIFAQFDMTPDLKRALKGDLKSYWFATLRPNGELTLDRRTGWRTW